MNEERIKAMKREDFIKYIEQKGYKIPNRVNAADRWIKEINGKTYGYKISKIAVRFERKVVFEKSLYGSKKTEWVRVYSAYLKNLSFDNDGRVVGFKR